MALSVNTKVKSQLNTLHTMQLLSECVPLHLMLKLSPAKGVWECIFNGVRHCAAAYVAYYEYCMV